MRVRFSVRELCSSPLFPAEGKELMTVRAVSQAPVTSCQCTAETRPDEHSCTTVTLEPLAPPPPALPTLISCPLFLSLPPSASHSSYLPLFSFHTPSPSLLLLLPSSLLPPPLLFLLPNSHALPPYRSLSVLWHRTSTISAFLHLPLFSLSLLLLHLTIFLLGTWLTLRKDKSTWFLENPERSQNTQTHMHRLGLQYNMPAAHAHNKKKLFEKRCVLIQTCVSCQIKLVVASAKLKTELVVANSKNCKTDCGQCRLIQIISTITVTIQIL